jgi:hypothetical protein
MSEGTEENHQKNSAVSEQTLEPTTSEQETQVVHELTTAS